MTKDHDTNTRSLGRRQFRVTEVDVSFSLPRPIIVNKLVQQFPDIINFIEEVPYPNQNLNTVIFLSECELSYS